MSGASLDLIKDAVNGVSCPVLANGNISSAQKAIKVQEYTGCYGTMVGRSAIRNPWIFRQIRELQAGETPFAPTLSDVREYIEKLYLATGKADMSPRRHVGMLKKFLNFIAQSVDEEGNFMHDIRRAKDPDDMRAICDRHLLGEHADTPYSDEPYQGLIARPNSE